VSSLVMNAIRSTDPGVPCPVLHARGLGAQGGVRLEVVDRGLGLAADARKKVFEPFLHTYYQEQGLSVGVGLSLYISKLLVTKLMVSTGHQLLVCRETLLWVRGQLGRGLS
jgi:C4-dicarboxylate-specific signal transduction histidine kinase